MRLYCSEGQHEVKVTFASTRGERMCPEHGCWLRELPKTSPRHQKQPPALALIEREAKKRFRYVVTQRPCFFLDRDEFGERRRPEHVCSYPLDAHHLIPKGWIKRELVLPPEELVAVIWNPLIGAPLCRGAHDPVTNKAEHIYWEELNPDLIAYCEAFDAEHPDCPSMLGRLELESPRREAA